MHAGTSNLKRKGEEITNVFAPFSQRTRNNNVPPPHYALMKPVIINTFEDMARNLVWLSKADYEKWFSDHKAADVYSTYQPSYIKIANRIYQTSPNSYLSEMELGITPLQLNELKDANVLFLYNHLESVQIVTMPSSKNSPLLSKITFRISHHDGFNNCYHKLTSYDLNELRQRCLVNLANKFAAEGQEFIVDLPESRIKLRVLKIKKTPNQSPFLPYGLINKNTQFDFSTERGANISIIKQEILDNNCRFNFRVSLVNNAKEKNNTLYINVEKLKQLIQNQLNGRPLAVGDKHQLNYQNDILEVSFQGIKNHILAKQHKTYQASYVLNHNSLRIQPGKHVTLITDNFFPAKEMQIEVYSVQRKAKKQHVRFLDVNELEKALYKIQTSFIQGGLVTLDLPNVKVQIEVKKAIPPEPILGKFPKRYKRQWQLLKDSKISFTTRRSLNWSLVDNLEGLEAQKIKVDISLPSLQTVTLPESDLKESIKKALQNGAIKNQTLNIDVHSNSVNFTVTDLDFVNQPESKVNYSLIGKLTSTTELIMNNKSSNLAVTCKSAETDPILYLKELGIGGLSETAKETLMKFLSQRISYLRKEWEKRVDEPTKGLLLYGPPGTGKTLLARNLAKILGCGEDRVKQICGTDIYSKWVGDSEKNVRELFAPALEAAKTFKDDSEVFLLIIDEIDGILSARQEESHRVDAKVVNTFLAQMDGLEQFHNIIVVGMTNRLESLDEAVLRSGRLGEQVEIGLPDLQGRKEIFQIHTKKMEKENLLAKNVDFDLLAKLTEGMSGADIKELVSKAAYYAIERIGKLRYQGLSIEDSPKRLTTMKDFYKALEKLKKMKEAQGNKEPIKETPFQMYS